MRAEETFDFRKIPCQHCRSITHECQHGIEPHELPFPGEPRSPAPQLPGSCVGLTANP